MIAPHRAGDADLSSVDDQGFDEFIALAFGVRSIGGSRLAFGFELPWLQYDNETVRRELREVAPELSIEVPYRKEGETRGPAGDLLIWFQAGTAVATTILTWYGLGALVKKVIDYLATRAPSVLITDGVAMTMAATAIFDQVSEADLSYAFVLPSSLCADLGVQLADRAYLCGFESDTRVAWCAISDEGLILFVDSAPASRSPDWWRAAKERDAQRQPTASPRQDEW